MAEMYEQPAVARKLRHNKIFDNLLWILGKNPMVYLSGKWRRPDVVAQSILDLDLFNVKLHEVYEIVKITVHFDDMPNNILPIEFKTNKNHSISCSKFIKAVNGYSLDYDIPNLYQIHLDDYGEVINESNGTTIFRIKLSAINTQCVNMVESELN